jgi:hypothetical protein
MTYHPWVLTQDQNWVWTQDLLVLGPTQDLRECGPDVVPKSIGSGGKTQAKWILTQDQNWVQTQDLLVVSPTQDPGELGPNAVLKRIGSKGKT